ncbi:VP4 [Trichosanthes kirilowii gokushovirus]|nr:VP4 [Trichosanthes kirilowii gokushovirus]
MSCNMPIDCYYRDELTESGKRPLTFNPRFRYRGADVKYTDALKVPCGKCSGCKADQSLMWSIRAYHESTLHDQNCFITLTYDDAHLPKDGKIDKTVLQKFFRRLRKAGYKLRYIACGEYGGRTHRPHYHAIIFGVDWLENAVYIDDKMYTNQKLVDLWSNGFVSIAPVTMASICYVCGYVTKKIADEDTFNLMSRRPGIGHDWLDRFHDDIVRTGVVTIEGREYQVPKRYLLWYEDVFQDIKAARAEHAKKASRGVDPMERRRAEDNREINKKARIQSRSTKEKI